MGTPAPPLKPRALATMHSSFLLVILMAWPIVLRSAEPTRNVTLVVDQEPGRATRHGLEQVETALRGRGLGVQRTATLNVTTGGSVIVTGAAAAV